MIWWSNENMFFFYKKLVDFKSWIQPALPLRCPICYFPSCAVRTQLRSSWLKNSLLVIQGTSVRTDTFEFQQIFFLVFQKSFHFNQFFLKTSVFKGIYFIKFLDMVIMTDSSNNNNNNKNRRPTQQQHNTNSQLRRTKMTRTGRT